MLLNPNEEIYHNANDPIYETFRQSIKDRENFRKNVINLKLNDKIRIWRTKRDIEEDCRKRMRATEQKKKKK